MTEAIFHIKTFSLLKNFVSSHLVVHDRVDEDGDAVLGEDLQ